MQLTSVRVENGSQYENTSRRDDRMGLVEHLLQTLAANAKVGSIGISELRWLYSFVIAASRARLRWTATDVQKRLVEQGVDEERAEELGQIYGHCRAALHLAARAIRRTMSGRNSCRERGTDVWRVPLSVFPITSFALLDSGDILRCKFHVVRDSPLRCERSCCKHP